MPSLNDTERPQGAVAVAKQYLRRERPVSALVVLLVVSLFLGTFLATSLLPALVVGGLLVVTARAPVVQSHGTVHLRTDDTPESVVEAFTSPTPPVLAFQWGIADEITTGDDSVTYRMSYLFGLRSDSMTVHRQIETTPNSNQRVKLDISANDQPWATYTATIRHTNDASIVDVEYTSNRRFGLRRVPQQIVADRYRNEALEVQGYTVVERDAEFGI
ncbi:hypothetical protein [Haloferax profundi]|uniref:Polyketide cyclase n=1 Tax=Haloferax profundi TaxID=1544718 RepID=A0A0W1SA09_9EURY|nr:hypothetical protein [Haloferax profundi]KTG22892.1 hypothetical protein AUR66_16780 [Haloferax profundi]